MASLIEDLISVLDKEYEVYNQLVPIAREKTVVIVKNDVTALSQITEKEQFYVDNITSLEKKREEIIQNIKTVINYKSDKLNLDVLISLLDKQANEQRKLSELRDKLKSTIQTLVELNNRNKALIEQSLEMIDFNMNVIRSTRMVPGNNNYTKGAASYDANTFGAGMFDAKQ